MRAPRPIRNVNAGDLIEMMLVVAVTTIVIIRIILELSGYPKLGGGGLHIAHVLYGGLMMIAALILVFALLNMSAQWAAAFVGGVGFGFFIDEVGKFISNDVNYFFEPAFAVMYVVFIILFFALWAIRRAALRPHDALANALSLLREERDGMLDAETKREILAAARPRRPRGRPRAGAARARARDAHDRAAQPHALRPLADPPGRVVPAQGRAALVLDARPGGHDHLRPRIPRHGRQPVHGRRRCRRRQPRLRDVVRDRLRRRHGDPHRHRPRRAAPLAGRVVPLVQGGDPGFPADHAGLRLLLRPALGPGRRDRRPAPVRSPSRT